MVETRIKRIDPKDIDQDIIEEFAKMLAEGKTVIFPTETVYGLGANALDEKAAQRYMKPREDLVTIPCWYTFAIKKMCMT